ncbi:MAG: hypothetical protein KKF46_02510 [Nanoarchaeota archaeon]|nr:hypothetical protein [Nanoarchaeota archaeon]MBU1321205.1 hypothetical protein [Nanoarchaeota archaeon]MBU1597010.1 hypothetical protein [Nanoarchaeota archaeon]MBU2441844.1 hypothetical protein [Nanoarchaeota archaeon]
MIQDVLAHIGLTSSESKVYLALLELGDSTRGDIVNKSGVAGSKVYELLEKLHEKGLVSVYIKDKIKHFKPIHPDQVMLYLENKKNELAILEKEAHNILPELLLKYNSSKEEQEVELLSGLKGLEIIFREQIRIMKKNETCYVIGGTKGSDETAIQAFFEKIHLLREKNKIKTKMLFNYRQKESTERLYSSKKYSGTETKYILHTSPVAINIFKNHTVIIIFGRKISAINIKSQDVAKSFIEYFQILWRTAKK